MSKLSGKKINCSGVEVTENNGNLCFRSSNGNNSFKLESYLGYKKEGDFITINSNKETMSKKEHAMLGTSIRSIENCINGLKKPFTKSLTLAGVGYKVILKDNLLTLKIGYSHDVLVPVPSYIQISVKDVTINLSCYDKCLLGNFAAELCGKRKYNVYSGYGIIDSAKIYRKKEMKK